MADHFDRTARRVAKLGGADFVGWLLRLPAVAYRFRGWLDSRQTRPANEPDGAGDTVGWVENSAAVGPDWLLVVEFQTEPDPLMFGRMLVYMGTKWQEEKPNDLPGDRFLPGGAVVTLTGRSTIPPWARWEAAKLVTGVTLCERNLEHENASAELAEMEAGRVPTVGLPFVALMQGGDDPGIIARWVALASREPNAQRRALWVSSVLILTDAVGRWEVWKEALKEFDVKTSRQVLEWQAEARAEGVEQGRVEGVEQGRVEDRVESVIEALTARFGMLPAGLLDAVRVANYDQLRAAFALALRAASLADFRRDANL